MHLASEVHKAVHKARGYRVALKRILMHNEKEGMPVTALREIKILKALRHPCIIDIVDMFVVRSMSPSLCCVSLRVDCFGFIRSWKGVASLGIHGVSIHGP